MTRVHILSDCHIEFSPMKDYTPPECDVVVLAGDIGVGFLGLDWAKETFKVPVIAINGNHEFYHQIPFKDHLEDMRKEAEGSNVHILENDTVIIGDTRFIGATLWTDFDLMGNKYLHQLQAQNDMSDYKHILTSGRTLRAEDTASEHLFSRYYIREEMAKPFTGKTVVVTHHAPSELSIHPMYEGRDLNAAYASRLEYDILDGNPVLWCHGHTHFNFDYMLGDTRIICNPRGYDNEVEGLVPNSDFKPGLVIEI